MGIYKDWDVPTQVLPSGASCSPGDGHWHRTSPFSTSQPYWQLAMPQVRASGGHKGNTTHFSTWGNSLYCSHTHPHLATFSRWHTHYILQSMCLSQGTRLPFHDISQVDPGVQTAQTAHNLVLLDSCAAQLLCAHTLAHTTPPLPRHLLFLPTFEN